MTLQPDLTEASDQEVVAQALEGRQDAYRELVRRYRQPVLSVIYPIVKQHERADDLTQDTFDKVFKALASYRPERKFSSWIFTIAKNAAVQHLRDKDFDALSPGGRADVVTLESIDRAAIDALLDDTPTPTPFGGIAAADLVCTMQQLRWAYRRCLELRYFEGLSYKEIAKALRVPLGTVATYLHRAKQALGEELMKALERSPKTRLPNSLPGSLH